MMLEAPLVVLTKTMTVTGAAHATVVMTNECDQRACDHTQQKPSPKAPPVKTEATAPWILLLQLLLGFQAVSFFREDVILFGLS